MRPDIITSQNSEAMAATAAAIITADNLNDSSQKMQCNDDGAFVTCTLGHFTCLNLSWF